MWTEVVREGFLEEGARRESREVASQPWHLAEGTLSVPQVFSHLPLILLPPHGVSPRMLLNGLGEARVATAAQGLKVCDPFPVSPSSPSGSSGGQ